MSKAKEHTGNPAEPLVTAGAPGIFGFFPKLLWIAYLAVILAGVAIVATRPARTEAAALDAFATCEASVMPDTNGLNDDFGLVLVKSRAGELSSYLSLCQSQPALALKVFREALASTNKSARLVAIYSAFYLARGNRLEKADFVKLASLLDPKVETDLDVRRAAQRELADLLILNTPAAKDKYEALPPNLPPEPENGIHSIATLEAGAPGARFLRIRWSNPDLADAWWKAHQNGAWSAARHAWVIP